MAAWNLNVAEKASFFDEKARVFCNSLRRGGVFQPGFHRRLSFPYKFAHRKVSIGFGMRISLQELIPEETRFDSEVPDGKSAPSKKSNVWVNPRSSRASKLREKSSDFRYASLVKVVQSLNSCEPIESNILEIISVVSDDIVEQDAVFILNGLTNSETAKIAMNHFLGKLNGCNEVVLYNITLRLFRECRDMNGVESLFNEMVEKGIKPDKYTFSTVISCARHCNLPEKSIEWYERMPSFGCEPDAVFFSMMIDAYGRMGKTDIALSLYDRSRNEKKRLDAKAFSTLMRIYGSMRDFDGCLNLYEEMKASRVKGNAGVYNSLLDAMGRANRPWRARVIYRDMLRNGIEPTWGTYASLIRVYSRARYGKDAVAVYKEMKEKGFELNIVLYNTLLSLCADVGFCDEAFEIFCDMKRCGFNPDSWTFASLVAVHCSNGNAEEAENKLAEMMEAGFEPNIYVLTSMVQCYGKSGRIDDVTKTFNRILELGITPDETLLVCLLKILIQAPKEHEKVIDFIEKVNPKLGSVVKLIVSEEKLQAEVVELLGIISPDAKKQYCNCLIDLCVKLHKLGTACELLELAVSLEIYTGVVSKTPMQWSLHLKSLSCGAALAALHVWMKELWRVLGNGEELPPFLGINVGKHEFSESLKEVNAPFREDSDKVGWLVTTRDAATSWLESESRRIVEDS